MHNKLINNNDRDALAMLQAWRLHDQQMRRIEGADGHIHQVNEKEAGDFRYEYTTQGDLQSIIEADGNLRQFEYDEKRRLRRVTCDNKVEATFEYDTKDRLSARLSNGKRIRYQYDPQGRLCRQQWGDADASLYAYDDVDRLICARNNHVENHFQYQQNSKLTRISQAHGSLALEMTYRYNDQGRLTSLFSDTQDWQIDYEYDPQGQLKTIFAGGKTVAEFHPQGDGDLCIQLADGGYVKQSMDPRLKRLLNHQVSHHGKPLLDRTLTYSEHGALQCDGLRHYRYDNLGRLSVVNEPHSGRHWRYRYDNMDRRQSAISDDNIRTYQHDRQGRLAAVSDARGTMQYLYDHHGRLAARQDCCTSWRYLYDDADRLTRIYRDNALAAQLTYDFKGRLVAIDSKQRHERYLYGANDELVAVTDAQGLPLRLMIHGPSGTLAEIHQPLTQAKMYYRHNDERGTTLFITDERGEVVEKFDLCPYGSPQATPHFLPCFGGHLWVPEAEMYFCTSRWYEPSSGCFITPDSYTGGPDDERLLTPGDKASRQLLHRNAILNDWLKQPRVRNRYTYCNNDPIGRIDPNGHWSFGGVLLSLLGAIWTLPNTLFGLIVEITCLVGEVIRWLVWLVTIGNVSWETPGFDAAASSRQNAFALVFSGGWLGSFPSLLGITFGNVFFVYKNWESTDQASVLYEHELRHTKQYGWFGPFFHLGLPIFGVYEWDVIINGYYNAWLERDARQHETA